MFLCEKVDLSLNKLFALYSHLMQETQKVFCALYGVVSRFEIRISHDPGAPHVRRGDPQGPSIH